MNRDELTALFDEMASTYDQKWADLAPIHSALHHLTKSVLAEIPAKANILCVGAGTGAEIVYLSEQFPDFRFTVVEPPEKMIDQFRAKADQLGILNRCVIHRGYLETLPPQPDFQAATCFLVSQFILEKSRRSRFFREISSRLEDEGLIVSSDLSNDVSSAADPSLQNFWFSVMKGGAISESDMERMREVYAKDIAILAPKGVEEILCNGGFRQPTLFFQAGMIHAWYSRKQSTKLELDGGAK
ncbi:MAG: class I SAM-dependent methyltransferase [Verrucomicrobiota bacterium JB023]|nr:class I SAM-dependent methyltransferase [Verrucomicrobiota bacterium JB023]